MFDELKKKGIIILLNGCLESNLINEGIKFTENRNKWIEDSLKYILDLSKEKLKETYIFNWIFE